MRNLTSKETIWHFTCSDCDNWWSYATVESWRPRKAMWCPHCGWKHGGGSLRGAPPTNVTPPNSTGATMIITPERESQIKELAISVWDEDYEGVPV